MAAVEYTPPVRGIIGSICSAKDSRIAMRVMGLDFASPIGLAGGFDKNARRARALAAFGFGHLELGTVTARAQAPNPEPNLFRLPLDRALINRLGFPNEGAESVAQRMAATLGVSGARRGAIRGVPVGVSIGKSRDVPIDPIEGAIDDYLASFRHARSVADFVVVNISSPNTKGLRAMQGGEIAHALLSAIKQERDRAEHRPPLLVKIAPDLNESELEELLAVVERVGVEGVVATNTTIARAGLLTDAPTVEAIGAGGLSGPPVRARALEVVRRVRARLGKSLVFVGVGGVESGADAMALVRAGASLVQMYTGFVYGGPGAPVRIARELARELDRLGARSLAELVGQDVQ